VLVKEGDDFVDRKKPEEAVKAYEAALQVKEDYITRQKLEEIINPKIKPADTSQGKGFKEENSGKK
jgi:predicted negative regulator of RcsB-dependent stress response